MSFESLSQCTESHEQNSQLAAPMYNVYQLRDFKIGVALMPFHSGGHHGKNYEVTARGLLRKEEQRSISSSFVRKPP